MNAAHLHLLLNHLPVIGTLFTILLLAIGVATKNTSLVRTSLVFFPLLALTAVAVMLTGEPAEHLVKQLPGVAKAAIHEHEEAAEMATYALGALGVASLALLVALRKRPRLPAGFALALLAFSLVPAAAMARTAYLGGQIRHSEIQSGAAARAAESGAEPAVASRAHTQGTHDED